MHDQAVIFSAVPSGFCSSLSYKLETTVAVVVVRHEAEGLNIASVDSFAFMAMVTGMYFCMI